MGQKGIAPQRVWTSSSSATVAEIDPGVFGRSLLGRSAAGLGDE